MAADFAAAGFIVLANPFFIGIRKSMPLEQLFNIKVFTATPIRGVSLY